MELAERHLGLLGHLSGRQADEAVGQQAAAGGLDDPRSGVHHRVGHAAPSLSRPRVGRPTDLDIGRSAPHTLLYVRSTDRGEGRCLRHWTPRSTAARPRRSRLRPSGWPTWPPSTPPARPRTPWPCSTATRPRRPTARWSAGASCPPPATSSTTSAGTPAPAPCATPATTATASPWSAAT